MAGGEKHPHVINFVGIEQRRASGRGRGHVIPRPLSRSEVERIFRATTAQEPVVRVDMALGDKIKVLTGPFKDFEVKLLKSALNGTSSRLCSPFLGEIPPWNWSLAK